MGLSGFQVLLRAAEEDRRRDLGAAVLTRMLVRVADAAEATLAASAGADIVELAVPGGEPDIAIAKTVRAAFPGLLRLCFEGMSLTPDLVVAAATVHADEIALAFDKASLPIPVVDAKLPPGLGAVALFRAGPDNLESVQRVKSRVGAVMLDAGKARLIDEVSIAHLDAFASACRSAGLRFGLAGGLETPDVSRLLLLKPDVLGFDSALRADHRSDGALDAKAIDAMRGLIPRMGAPRVTDTSKLRVTDRIFVRDFTVQLAIGAYQAELGTRQRVRFSVEADVLREPVPPRDMRDVFSYDIIIETIRVLAERAHVTFVETLAEEVAAALLTHPALPAVTVKVEKLDVIDGFVGIEVTRRRP